MKLTNFAMINIVNILEDFSEKKLPQKISYALTRNIIILEKDYNCYTKSLNKLFSEYDKYIVRDEENNIINNDIGIPIVDSSVSKEFNEEIANLLNIEIDVKLYQIPEDTFNYEDNTGIYDALSAADIINLQAILCNREGSDNDEIPN